MRLLPAVLIDAGVIVVFAVVGRLTHGESAWPPGVLRTAWPFLAGAVAGMVAGRIWRRPTALVTGVFVWLGALIGGMLLRWLTSGGVQVSFVIVAGVILGLLLIGWRALCHLIVRVRTRSSTPKAA